MSIDLTPYWPAIQNFLTLVLVVLAPVVVGYLIKVLSSVWGEIKQHEPDLATELQTAADFAVKAAEQSGLAQLIENTSVAKKKYACDLATAWLATRGIKLDVGLIEAAVEAAVILNYPHPPQLVSIPLTTIVTSASPPSQMASDPAMSAKDPYVRSFKVDAGPTA